MGYVTYALMAHGLVAVISACVIGIIVVVNKAMS